MKTNSILIYIHQRAGGIGHPVRWKDWDRVYKLAPLGWKEQNGIELQDEEKQNTKSTVNDDDISAKKSKST
jgi:hypothetical protein